MAGGCLLPDDAWRPVLRCLCRGSGLHEAHLDVEEDVLLKRQHQAWTLMLVCKQLLRAVEAESWVLVVSCLGFEPESFLGLLSQGRCRALRTLRLDYNRRHCDLCATLARNTWVFSELQAPNSMSLELPVQDAWLVLAPPGHRCSARRLQRAWRERAGRPYVKDDDGGCRTRALLSSVQCLNFAGPVPASGLDRARSIPTRKAFPLQWMNRCHGLKGLSLRRTSLDSHHGLHLPSLRLADVSHCRSLGDEGVALFFHEHCNLVSFKMQCCSRVRNPKPFGAPSLEHFDCLGCSSLTDEAVSRLFRSSSLEWVVLSECGQLESPELGGPHLEDFIASCTHLSDEAVRGMLARSPQLRTLGLALCSTVRQPLGAHSLLRKVVLRRCDNVDDGCIEEMLAGCPELRAVDCRGCHAVRAPALRRAARFSDTPVLLDLRGCMSADGPALHEQCQGTRLEVRLSDDP